MAKVSKVDTKALEDANKVDLSQDQSLASSDPIHHATECFLDVAALFGTTPYQMENVARQFVQSAEYLVNGKRRQLDWDEHKLQQFENSIGQDHPDTESASYAVRGMQNELTDLLRFRKAATEAYELATGKKYEPLPQKKKPAQITVSPMDRLAAARAARRK